MASITLVLHFCPEPSARLATWQEALPDASVRARATLATGEDLAPGTLLELAAQVPFCLAASNLGWEKLAAPDLPAKLQRHLNTGKITPLLAHGNRLHAAFASPEEMERELATNLAFLHQAAKSKPRPRGVYAEALCFDSQFAQQYLDAGVSWAIAADGAAQAPFSVAGLTLVPPWITNLAGIPEQPWETPAQPAIVAFELQTQADFAALENFIVEAQSSGHTFATGFAIPLPPQAYEGAATRFGFYPRRNDLVRADGLYPALTRSLEGPEAYQPAQLYQRRPFVLWESGLPLSMLITFLTDNFSHDAGLLDLGSEARHAFHDLKEGRHWGVLPPIGEETRIGMAILILVKEFRIHLHEGRAPRLQRRIETGVVQALRVALAWQIDNRLHAVETGLQSFGVPAQVSQLRPWIVEAREHRLRAAESLNRLDEATQAVAFTPGAWYRVIDMFDVYGRELLLAADALANLARETVSIPAIGVGVSDSLAKIWPPQAAVALERIVRASRHARTSKDAQNVPAAHPEGRP